MYTIYTIDTYVSIYTWLWSVYIVNIRPQSYDCSYSRWQLQSKLHGSFISSARVLLAMIEKRRFQSLVQPSSTTFSSTFHSIITLHTSPLIQNQNRIFSFCSSERAHFSLLKFPSNCRQDWNFHRKKNITNVAPIHVFS